MATRPYWFIADQGQNPLVIVPSVVAITLAATHITQAGRCAALAVPVAAIPGKPEWWCRRRSVIRAG